MIFTALLASLFICSLSVQPLMVGADSSISEDIYIEGFDNGQLDFDPYIRDVVSYLDSQDVSASTQYFTIESGYVYWCDYVLLSGGEVSSYSLCRATYNSDDFRDYSLASVPFVIARNGQYLFVKGNMSGLYINGPTPSFTPAQSIGNYLSSINLLSSNISVRFYPLPCINDFVIVAKYSYDTAYRRGYDAGVAGAPAINAGYAYDDGYRAGWAVGYNKGKDDGYYSGRLIGQTEVSNVPAGIMTLFSAIANIPISVIGGFGELAVWDVPIISILATFIIICLFCWVLKKVM